MIDFQTITVSERCNEVYDSRKDCLKNEQGFQFLISHFGYFSQDLVNGFTENVEEMLISAGERKQMVKRIFSILIEGLQNIRVHGSIDDEGKHNGAFFLAKKHDQYLIFFGSLIPAPVKFILDERISRLNRMDDEQLKEHYMSILTNGIVSATGNAGLGFITMRMKSKSLIKMNFYPVSDDFAYFTTEIVLKKED